jgi:hypothetical protein
MKMHVCAVVVEGTAESCRLLQLPSEAHRCRRCIRASSVARLGGSSLLYTLTSWPAPCAGLVQLNTMVSEGYVVQCVPLPLLLLLLLHEPGCNTTFCMSEPSSPTSGVVMTTHAAPRVTTMVLHQGWR